MDETEVDETLPTQPDSPIPYSTGCVTLVNSPSFISTGGRSRTSKRGAGGARGGLGLSPERSRSGSRDPPSPITSTPVAVGSWVNTTLQSGRGGVGGRSGRERERERGSARGSGRGRGGLDDPTPTPTPKHSMSMSKKELGGGQGGGQGFNKVIIHRRMVVLAGN